MAVKMKPGCRAGRYFTGPGGSAGHPCRDVYCPGFQRPHHPCVYHRGVAGADRDYHYLDVGVWGIAIDQVVNDIGALGANGLTEVPLATFQMIDELPMADIVSFIGIVLVLVFFITSSDSGSLVIDSITAGGKIDAPVPQRIFWASIEGAIAAVLLWVGGTEAMQALQAGTISTGLPFTVVLLLMCVSLVMGLRTEKRGR